MGKQISFKRPDGKSVNGYLAGDKGPGMVVIQEWWGMNDQIRGVADKLAAAELCEKALGRELHGRVTRSGLSPFL